MKDGNDPRSLKQSAVLLKPRTVAELLDGSLDLVYSLVRRGVLPVVRLGDQDGRLRIPAEAVDALLKSAVTRVVEND